MGANAARASKSATENTQKLCCIRINSYRSAVPNPYQRLGSIRLGSLFLTLPTCVLTGQATISSDGYGASRALSWVPSAHRCEPNRRHLGDPDAAQSSLDVFEMPDILKGETARLPLKRHIYKIWLILSGLCSRPLIVRSPSTRQLIVNELYNCMALRNNPPKWWITLLEKLMSASNYERLLRFLDICPKNRHNITT